MRGSNRSGACWTCRRRRIKCDQGRPFCHRCQKAGYRCDGYKPVRKFINHTIDHQQSLPQVDQFRLNLGKTATYDQFDGCSRVLLPSTAFSAQTSIAFLSASLFPGQLPGHSQPEDSWILSSIRNDQSSVVFSTALCLARLYFARIHRYPLSSEIVVNDYNKALRSMRNHLNYPTFDKANVLFAGIICLMFFEMIRPTTLTSVKHHSDAISILITRLGPETFSTQPMHAHYLQARSIIIGRDLLHGTKCELAEEKWKVVPWKDGFVKTSHHFLWDLVADTCNLIADTSEALFKPSNMANVVATRNRLICTLHRLACWRWAWQDENGSGVHETNCTLTRTFLPQHFTDAIPPILPISYQDVERSRDLMLYNTAMLHLLHLAYLWDLDTTVIFHEAYVGQNVPDRCAVSLPLPGLTTSCIVRDIARSMDYHLMTNRYQCSLSFLPLAINAMHRTCLNHAMRQWLRSLTGRLVQVSGFEFFRMVCAGDAAGLYTHRIEKELSAMKRLRENGHSEF